SSTRNHCSIIIITYSFFFFQAEDGIRFRNVTGVQTCALPISARTPAAAGAAGHRAAAHLYPAGPLRYRRDPLGAGARRRPLRHARRPRRSAHHSGGLFAMKMLLHDPAARWTEALPLGNGRLGAMVFGDPAASRFQLNEDSCWPGSPATARVDGREATRLEQMLQRGYSQAYQPLADLVIEQAAAGPSAVSTRRILDLAAATASTRWTAPTGEPAEDHGPRATLETTETS